MQNNNELVLSGMSLEQVIKGLGNEIEINNTRKKFTIEDLRDLLNSDRFKGYEIDSYTGVLCNILEMRFPSNDIKLEVIKAVLDGNHNLRGKNQEETKENFRNSKFYPLIRAVSMFDKESIKLILSYGVDVNNIQINVNDPNNYRPKDKPEIYTALGDALSRFFASTITYGPSPKTTNRLNIIYFLINECGAKLLEAHKVFCTTSVEMLLEEGKESQEITPEKFWEHLKNMEAKATAEIELEHPLKKLKLQQAENILTSKASELGPKEKMESTDRKSAISPESVRKSLHNLNINR
ncbi:MAG: hypothetical protein ACK4OM_02320 [Alphaproteobacteria bacterium]